MYSNIVFFARDSWGRDAYSFRINMLTREISLEYKNNKGGYTSNGVKINDKNFRRLKRICELATEFFHSPMFDVDVFPLDPNIWELKMIKVDGSPTLELKSHMPHIYVTPDFVYELVCFVMDLASFDNKGFRYF